jgi:hypothetical protein
VDVTSGLNFETSAKTGEGIEDLIHRVAIKLVETKEEECYDEKTIDRLLTNARSTKKFGRTDPLVYLFLKYAEPEKKRKKKSQCAWIAFPMEIRMMIFDFYFRSCILETAFLNKK